MRGRRTEYRAREESRSPSPVSPRSRRRPRRFEIVLRPAHILLLLMAAGTGLLVGWISRGTNGSAPSNLLSLVSPPPPLPPPPPAPATRIRSNGPSIDACGGAELGFAVVRGSDCVPHRMLFIGGLQRSGTSTLASLLQALPNVSALEFDVERLEHIESAPWKRLLDVHTGGWMKWAYFKEVAAARARTYLLQMAFIRRSRL